MPNPKKMVLHCADRPSLDHQRLRNRRLASSQSSGCSSPALCLAKVSLSSRSCQHGDSSPDSQPVCDVHRCSSARPLSSHVTRSISASAKRHDSELQYLCAQRPLPRHTNPVQGSAWLDCRKIAAIRKAELRRVLLLILGRELASWSSTRV